MNYLQDITLDKYQLKNNYLLNFASCETMRNVTNYAEESPFVDMTSQVQLNKMLSRQCKQMDIQGEQIKKNLPQPDFRIYKPTLKYNYEQVNVPNQQHNKKVNKIIQTIEQGIKINLRPQDNQQLKFSIKNNKQLIINYIQQGYPSCIYIGVIASNLQGDFNIDFPALKYRDIKELQAKHKNYPPLLTAIAKQLFLTQRQNRKWEQYLNKAAVEYGYAFAFVEYGILLLKKDDKIKAYQMFKNAQHLGLVGISTLYLGKLCYQGGLRVHMNLYRSFDYYKISERLGVKFDKENQLFYQHTKSLYDYGSYNDKEMITTEQTEALVVSRFLVSKFNQQLYFQGKKYDLDIRKKLEIGKGLNTVFKTQPRIFYVVCTPQLTASYRGILAEEKDTGFIEIINIYKWQQIPTARLKLLHKQGTKVTLRNYLRKLDNFYRTPKYRVQDPTSVDIEQASQRRIISQGKYRNIGRLLFGSGHYELALAVYRVLEERGCSQLEIVFSNAGLCHQKLNNQNEAMNFYKKSLKVKKFLKSQTRLASLHIKRKQFEQANKIIVSMDESKQKSEMVQKLNLQMNKQIEKTNLQFITFLKGKKRAAKMTPYIQDPTRNAIGWKQMQYGFRINRTQFEAAIKTTFTSDDQYIKKIKYLIIDFIDIPQSQISSKNPDIATFFQLTSFTKIFAYIVRSGIQPRQRSMMNRIQNYCQEREIDGDIQQAINMLKIVAPRSVIMTIKLAQLLRKQNKINESIQVCNQYWLNDDLDSNFAYYQASLNLQLIKSEIKAKKFSLNKCKQYLQNINKKGQNQKTILDSLMSLNNLNLNILTSTALQKAQLYNKLYRFRGLTQIRQYLLKLNWTPLSIKQQIYLQISIALGKQRKFDDSFKYLSQILINHARKIHPGDVYYRAVIFRILLLQDNGQINESITQTDRLIKILRQNQKQVENYKAYRKTLLQQKISSYLKEKNHEKIAKICEQIIQFSLQNYQYVVKKLSAFIFEDRSVVAGKLLKQVQNSNVISFLFDELQAKLQVSTISEQQMLHIIKKNIQKKDKILKTKSNTQLIYQIPKQINLIQASKEYQDFKKNKQTGMDKFLDELQEYEDMQRDLQFGFEGIEGLIMHFYHEDNYQQYAIILSPKLEQSHKQLKQFHRVTNKLFIDKENQDELKNLGNKAIKIIVNNSEYSGNMKKKNGVHCCIFDKLATK